MTNRKHRNDICIGDDEWIEFIDLQGRHNQAVEIDEYLEDLWPLIDRLETYCVAGCCGFGAYDFTAMGIANAISELDPHALHEACTDVKRAIATLDSEVVVSSKMNNLSDKRTFMHLLEHLDNCVMKRLPQQNNAAPPTGINDC